MLASGVTIWTAYMVGLLWAHANAIMLSISFSSDPALFFLIAFFTGPWVAFHFYWGHRMLHLGRYIAGFTRFIIAMNIVPGPAFRCIRSSM